MGDNNFRAFENQYNGRIFLNPNESFPDYELFNGENSKQNLNVNIISNIITPNKLTYAYFNVNNMNYIHNEIIKRIKKLSNGQYNISKQSDTQLEIIMRSYYLQYGKNLDYNIEQQVNELNEMVIKECISIIIPNVQQYLTYLKDITNPIPVMPLPINPSNAGNKPIDVTKIFWNTNNIYNS